MKDAFSLALAVEEAWADVPAPPLGSLPLTIGGWSQGEANAFIGVAPMNVNINSTEFLAATPLGDLPPQAAGAYLGTFLRAVMVSLHEQQVVKIFEDPLTRAHLITCLKDERFWNGVIKSHISGKRQEVLVEVIKCMIQNREDLALDDEDVEVLRARVAA